MPLFRNERFMLDEMTADETFQNLPYFICTKTQISFFHFVLHYNFINPLMNALVDVIENFEAFRRVISSSINLLFLKSATLGINLEISIETY